MPDEKQESTTAPIIIDGREFVGITQDLTAAQDDFVIVALTETSAFETIAEFNKAPTPEARGEQAGSLITRVLKSGKQFELLAGFLTEKGKKWTRASAMENAARFANVTDANEKLLMHKILVQHVSYFFPLGPQSSTTSPKSSNPSNEAPVISNAEAETSGVSS